MNQSHSFHALTVLDACGDDINSCRVDTAVSENVGKFRDILFDTVEHTSKQMSQIMRKNLLRIDIGILAKAFHFSPDFRPTDRSACLRYKDKPLTYSAFLNIPEQFFLKFLYKKYSSRLSFERDGCFAASDRIDRYKLKFTHTDSCSELLNDLVDKIVIHAPDKSSGKRKQKIEIYYKSASIINICDNDCVADDGRKERWQKKPA